MLLRKLKLKNIRSYVAEEINFPEGTTLLSGDIGSGKSTILLAIDFALFGIRRGELSGSALLRNGKQEGNVTLDFTVEDKEISIKRTIKKSTNGIVQDAGYITVNDITEQLTPLELKQRVLQLLNYPQETLNKKSLVYRYTVYTPQEEMKLILLGGKEDRLETLRRVFNIDKYRRIKDNSKILNLDIKQRKKECLGIIQDLEEKKLKLYEYENHISQINESLQTQKLRLQTTNQLIEHKKQEIKKFEEQVEKLNKVYRDLEILNNNYLSKEEHKLRSLNQLKLIENQLSDMNINKNELDIFELKEKIIKSEKLAQELELELREVLNGVITIKNKKQNSEEIKSNIIKLDLCSICKQNVPDQHKHSIISREEQNLKELNLDLDAFIKKEHGINDKLKETKNILQEYKNKEKEHELNNIKFKELNLKKQLIENLKKDIKEAEEILCMLLSKKDTLNKELENLRYVETNYKKSKDDLDELLIQQRKIEIYLASLLKEEESLQREINNIKPEIIKKEQARKKLDYLIKLQDWTENFLINVIEIIEKKVMLKVNIEFNALFQKWFYLLVNTDLIKIKLDEEFTPLIEQNDHDIEYENLSGGEKTACALAYRLALNQVINTIASSINTRDIIILDEPTDGFSLEQLDKIRDVLDELKMRQIIIVSHESKIESFVQSIIKIKKDGHISNVVA